MSIHDILKQKPYLAWYVKNPEHLSDQSVLEHILNYGNWEDVQQFIAIKGWNDSAKLFFQSLTKKRTNYTPEIQSYFTRYFHAHHA